MFRPVIQLGSTALAGCLMAEILLAQVVPDGNTNTTVNLGRNGDVTIGIAGAGRDGVSLNRYDQFNVPKPGVRLDNRREAARTIVNEVTGTTRSEMKGPLEVMGQRAHVIVANPNGIVLDGARFVNTGRVGLATGRITLEDRQIAPGVFQKNPVATVDGGVIEIGPGGLSGQMDAVNLIAHQLNIAGPVTNTSSREGSALKLVAGHSRTEFDSAVLPGNTSAAWSRSNAGKAGDDQSVLIEITRAGVLRANRIGIEVNGRGAGVRFAGAGYAGSRGFSLRSDGEVVLDDGQIEAEGATVELSARKLHFNGAEVSANRVAAQAAEDIEFQNSSFTGTGEKDAPRLIYFDAGRAFSDLDGHYVTDGLVQVETGTTLSFRGSDLRSEGNLWLSSGKTLSVDDAVMRARGNLVASAGELRFSGTSRQSEIVAEAGSLILSSTGDLVNQGSLLQGGTHIPDAMAPDKTRSAGAVTIKTGGDVINRSDDQLAVIFGAGGDVVADAGGDIDNLHGRFLANGGLDLAAVGTVSNRIELPNGQRAPIITQERRHGKRLWWTLGLKRERRYRLVYDFGTVRNSEHLGMIRGSDAVEISAGTRILNEGGQIQSSGDNVSLTAPIVETASVGSGRVELQRACVFACSYEGGGEILSYGGQIEAAKDLGIMAEDLVLNDGGALYAGQDVTIDTAQLDARASRIPTVAYRPGGLYNFWASRAAWVFLREQFGQIVAETGKLTLRSPAPARVQGGVLSAGDGMDLSSGQEIVTAPDMKRYTPGAIGWFRGIPLLKE